MQRDIGAKHPYTHRRHESTQIEAMCAQARLVRQRFRFVNQCGKVTVQGSLQRDKSTSYCSQESFFYIHREGYCSPLGGRRGGDLCVGLQAQSRWQLQAVGLHRLKDVGAETDIGSQTFHVKNVAQLSVGLGVNLRRYADAELSDVHLTCVAVDVGTQRHGLSVIGGRGVHQQIAQTDVVAVFGDASLQLVQRHACVLFFHRRLRHAYPQLIFVREE